MLKGLLVLQVFGTASSHSPMPVVDGVLEQKLRAWWGATTFDEFLVYVADDSRDYGYLLASDFNQSVREAMTQIATRHDSKDPCSSLPVEVAVHAWRYDQVELAACLSSGKSCLMHCGHLATAVEMVCQESTSGWTLTGAPLASKCKWVLDAETVDTTGGLVQGLVRPIPWKWADGHVSYEMTRTFWGVRYADQPERFSISKPLEKRWKGVHVTDYLDIKHNYSLRMHCAGAAPLDTPTGGEDCLFVDIYVPPNASVTSPRPVMAFMFAAGFVYGDAWKDGQDDGSRIALRDDVVMVVMSTRTAALGHWAHPALSEEYGDGSAGNIGERDQRVALQWIQSNIRKFGGDADKVTLWGHSSSSFDAAFHLYSPASHGLFAGVVSESATFDSAWYWQTRDQAFTFYAQFGEAIGCAPDSGDGAQIECLRALPLGAFYNFTQTQANIFGERLQKTSKFVDAWSLLKSILAASIGVGGGYKKAGLLEGDSEILATPLWPYLPFGLVVDGTDAGVPADPRQLYETDRVADVPVYLSHEHDEGTIFATIFAAAFPWQKSVSLTHSAVDAMIEWAYGGNSSYFQDLVKLYPHGTGENAPFYRLSNMITDSVFKCSARRFAAARSKHHPGTTYWAEHTFAGSSVKSHSLWEAIKNKDFGYFFGANHCLPTLQFWGYEAGGEWNEVDQKNHDLMHCHLGLMLHCGDPGAALESTCRQRLKADSILPLACEGLNNTTYPFAAFDASTGHRNQMSPSNHSPIAPSAQEIEVCKFWDAAPPMGLRRNSCRGCAAARTPLDVVV